MNENKLRKENNGDILNYTTLILICIMFGFFIIMILISPKMVFFIITFMIFFLIILKLTNMYYRYMDNNIPDYMWLDKIVNLYIKINITKPYRREYREKHLKKNRYKMGEPGKKKRYIIKKLNRNLWASFFFTIIIFAIPNILGIMLSKIQLYNFTILTSTFTISLAIILLPINPIVGKLRKKLFKKRNKKRNDLYKQLNEFKT